MDNQGQVEYLQTEINKCEQILALKHEPGWKLLMEHVSMIKQAIIEGILVEVNPTTITRLQERYRAFKELSEVVDSFASQIAKCHEERNNIELEMKVDSEYNLNT